MVCPWPFLVVMDSTEPLLPKFGKTIAQALSNSVSGTVQFDNLPPKVIMGDTVRVKITQKEYERGIADCRRNLHGKLTLNKGDPPLTTLVLKVKLSGLWPMLKNWTVTPLGKGFFEFKFNTIEDMRKVWAMRLVNLMPGLLHFYCWSKDFTPQHQTQMHAQIWICLLHLPQEYWRQKTLYEIASGIGTPLTIDTATLERCFGLYAKVLVDVDLSNKMFESVMVERKGLVFPVSVQYERQPLFCAHCNALGHSIQNCMKIVYGVHKGEPETAPSKEGYSVQKANTKGMANTQLRHGVKHQPSETEFKNC